jgi:hypothetical protein
MLFTLSNLLSYYTYLIIKSSYRTVALWFYIFVSNHNDTDLVQKKKMQFAAYFSAHFRDVYLYISALFKQMPLFCYLYHLIFYVTGFSIGSKIGMILCHPNKISDVYAKTSQNTQAPYSIVQKQIMEHIKFYYIIFMFFK